MCTMIKAGTVLRTQRQISLSPVAEKDKVTTDKIQSHTD